MKSLTFTNVYLRLIVPNTCTPNSGKCEPVTCAAPTVTCSQIEVVEALNKASKKEIEELRDLLAALQRELEPHIEAAGKAPRVDHAWGEDDIPQP